jgi:hypothetical protein
MSLESRNKRRLGIKSKKTEDLSCVLNSESTELTQFKTGERRSSAVRERKKVIGGLRALNNHCPTSNIMTMQ